MTEPTAMCYKCRHVVLLNGGYFKRKNNRGPCDRCLGQMTTMQMAMEKQIWLHYVPMPEPQPQKQNNTNKQSGSVES